MRIIDADEVRKKAVPHTKGGNGRWCANIRKWAVLVGDIDDAPTVDAVEVVRCKDCNKNKKEHGYLWCDIWDAQVLPDDFCSCGESRNDG